MGRPSGLTCVDSQTIAECDIECGSGRLRNCRVWDVKPSRKLTPKVALYEDEYLALLQVAGAARSHRVARGRAQRRSFLKALLDALDTLDRVQAQGGKP
jgi:hypothetical protein